MTFLAILLAMFVSRLLFSPQGATRDRLVIWGPQRYPLAVPDRPIPRA